MRLRSISQPPQLRAVALKRLSRDASQTLGHLWTSGFLVKLQTPDSGVLGGAWELCIYNQLLLDTLMQLVQDLMSGKDGAYMKFASLCLLLYPHFFPSPDREQGFTEALFTPFKKYLTQPKYPSCRSLVSYYTILNFSIALQLVEYSMFMASSPLERGSPDW